MSGNVHSLPKIHSKDDIERLKSFWASEMPSVQIARQFNVSIATLYATAKRIGLPLRTHSESVKSSTGRNARRNPAPEKTTAATVKPKPPAYSREFTGLGDWTEAHDLAVFTTKGSYREIGKLADLWRIPSTRIMARWHIVRAQK